MRNLFQHYLEAEWPELRKLGRESFIWRQRVLPFGLPIALGLIVWVYSELGYRVPDLLRFHGAAVAYLILTIGLGLAYASARLEWNEREAKYKRKRDAR